MKSRLFCKTATALAVSVLATGTVYAQQASADQAKEEAAPRAKEDTVRLGTITVIGTGAKLGTGLMINDDSVKGRSTLTKAAMEKELGTGNVLQSIAQLPGVNTYNYDATGMFGGDVTIRGFGNDQIGFTVNGVPVNDSGGYSFYAQEMIDKENVCTASVAQGSVELESPNSGASGGSVSMVTCDPVDKFRVRAAHTMGGLNLKRTFVRVDSGRFLNEKAKVFLSYSHAEADKWKGSGSAKKDHIDAGFSLDLNEDNKILGSILYNRMMNQNVTNVSLAQYNNPTQGYFYDFTSPTFNALKVPGNGAQVDVSQSPIYYGLNLNPFKNVIASVSGSFKLAQDTYLKVQPYYWYGFGNGGWGTYLLDETGTRPIWESSSSTSKSLIGGAVDINGDGDKLDTVLVARASVTKTNRPGITAEVSTTLGNHFLKAGLWFERAEHRQTQPAVRINTDGTPADRWLQEGCVKRSDGSCYEGRNTKTISTVYQAYLGDQISLLNDRAFVNLGLRLNTTVRDVTNYANETGFPTYTGTPGSYVSGPRVYNQDFNIKRTFHEALPQLGGRFNIDSQQHVFANVSKNFRAPPNYAYMVSSSGVYVASFNGGAVRPVQEIQSETTVMVDAGYRFQTRDVSLTATLFSSDFKDRQVQVTDEETKLSTYLNAGGVKNRGLELELGSGVFGGFSAYGSLTLQSSEMKDNLRVTAATATTPSGLLPTAGKQFAKTPEKMAALSVQYEQGPIYARLKGKFTGAQYADLMNQEKTQGFTSLDLDAGYKFGDWGMLKNPQLRLNVANLGNKQARAGVASVYTNTAAVPALVGSGAPYTSTSTAYYYLLAPRFTSLTFSVDFE
ncbi:TonB-dependent receptor [Roseateles sp. BYS96W]|uniref:TonB-dependent receptor n=1 Tax=Pelomonas nitida TaxID=3299027 RepID=A0ABW7G463_9BURK